MQDPIINNINHALSSFVDNQVALINDSLRSTILQAFKPYEEFQKLLNMSISNSIPRIEMPYDIIQSALSPMIKQQQAIMSNISKSIQNILANAGSVLQCVEMYENQIEIEEENYTFDDDILLKQTLSYGESFVSDSFPTDISIRQLEAVFNSESDDDVESLTDEQLQHVQSIYKKEFSRFIDVTSIDEFAILFDRLNVLTDIIPGYQAKYELYHTALSFLLNGLNSAIGTVAYLLIMFILHKMLKHFQQYNDFLKVIKNFKDDNPLI